MIHLSEVVREALASNQPVVALESTIIAHGMPWPENKDTALEVESIIQEQGAVPATIAVIEGEIRVGLDRSELELLASSKDVLKLSTKDLSFAIAQKKTGATTVAATMFIAHKAGIKVFVTGGIGGVHRGVEKTWDISADLHELSRTAVAVVCAGAKSILDLPKTLEYLETLCVPVIGYRTEYFPAFYQGLSTSKVPIRLDEVHQISTLIRAHFDLNIKSGLVIGNPIPSEFAMNQKVINEAIEKALEKCNDAGIEGKAVTPFLLSEIKEITGGDSLQSNVALIKNNAYLGAKIAVMLED